MHSGHLTPKQIETRKNHDAARNAYRIAGHGERARAYARLRQAADEVISADNEAARVERFESDFQGAPV